MDRKAVIKKVKLAIQIIVVIFLLASIYFNVNFFILIMGETRLFVGKKSQYISSKFIESIADDIKKDNKGFIEMRKYIKKQHQHYQKVGKLSHFQYKELNVEYQYYNHFDPIQNSNWDKLDEEINKVPASLLIAIAIYNLTISKVRNHYKRYYRMFAVPCHILNCGIPADREKNYLFTAYTSSGSLQGAVFGEIHMINSAPEYKKWREVRAKLQKENKPLSPYVLADALLLTPYYDQKKVNKIKEIIKQWRLERFD